MRRRKRKKIEAMDIICYAAALIVVVITLYPVLHLMALSFSSSGAVSKNTVSIWPKEFTLQAYRQVLSTGTVPNSFINSIVYTAIGTAINMLFTSTMAYALSKAQAAVPLILYKTGALDHVFKRRHDPHLPFGERAWTVRQHMGAGAPGSRFNIQPDRAAQFFCGHAGGTGRIGAPGWGK